jgi:hypothetical protein
MTVLDQLAKPAALFLVFASITCASGPARAETGLLWFDSVFAAPTVAPASAQLYFRRPKPARVMTMAPVSKPILVSAVSPRLKSDCFWCNRPVYVSGLSF